MARSRRKALDGLPLRKLGRLTRLLDQPCPSKPADRVLHFQAIRQAASNLQAAGNLGLLEELSLSQHKRLQEANRAQREDLEAKSTQSSAVSA